jgi:excisionase family DNA binding protein
MYPHDLNELVTNKGLKSQMEPMLHAIQLMRAELQELRRLLGKARVIPADPDFLSPKEFGAQVGYRERTIQKWCAEGRIQALQMCDGGSWRIPVSELERIESKYSENLETEIIYKVVD